MLGGKWLPLVGGGGVCPLLPHHVDYLQKRAVPQELAVAQGLRSIEKGEGSELLGDPIPCAGLLIPYLESQNGYCRVRLDWQDKPRFLAPKGQEVPVYIAKNIQLPPNTPIVVAEGPIKALALLDQGFYAVGLGGTGTTLMGSGDRRTLNPSWEPLDVSKRPIIIMFDTNRSHNLRVARDEARLVLALEKAGARDIRIARLVSSGDNDGPDDILASQGKTAIEQAVQDAIPARCEEYAEKLFAGSSNPAEVVDTLLDDLAFLVGVSTRGSSSKRKVEEFFKARKALSAFRQALHDAETELRTQDASQSEQPHYAVVNGTLHLGSGESSRELANFSASIVEDICIDDGTSHHSIFIVEGSLRNGAKLPKVRLSPRQFSEKEWWLEGWGACAYQTPGPYNHAHLNAAIQQLSNPAKRWIYAHTGWRDIGGKHLFLTSAGAVGGEKIQVELGPVLDKFNLPSDPQDLPGAVRTTLRLLDLAEQQVSFPLLLAAFRAPLMTILPVDGAIHLHGRTGSFKSSTAALIQSFFGHFNHHSLPASFGDTYAALEHKLHQLKDVVVVVDEYTPKSTDPNDDIRKKAIQLFRMIGNGAPRARMTSTMEERPSKPPRALVITTGEELPSGESIVARTLSLSFTNKTVCLEKLTLLGKQKHRLAAAMAGYVAYLAPRLDAIGLWAEKSHRELLPQFELAGVHPRAPSMAAHLALAAELFAEYAMEVGVFDENKANEFIQKSHKALREAIAAQTSTSEAENPGLRFIDLLSELIQNGRVVLLARDQPLKENNQVGWRAGAKVWLLPNLVHEEVAKSARNQGQPITVGQSVVWGALAALGVLTKPQKDRFTVQRLVGGEKRRVIELDRSCLEPISEASEDLPASRIFGDEPSDVSNSGDDIKIPPANNQIN